MRNLLEKLLNNQIKHQRWLRVIRGLAMVVVFCMVYVMILPAITWDKTLICEEIEHTHSESCYEGDVLVCGLEEHVHDDTCFDAPPADLNEYICLKSEHEHSEAGDCFYADGALKCTLEEHAHGEECLKKDEALIIDNGVDDKEDTDLTDLSDELDGSEELQSVPLMMEPFNLMALNKADDDYVSEVIRPDIVNTDPKANDWQIVSGQYLGTTVETKTIQDEDGNVLRLRKNIIPSGVENEFYIYMTVEPVFYHNWSEIFKASGMLVVNSNNNMTFDGNISFSNDEGIDSVLKKLGKVSGLSSLLVPATNAPLTRFHTEQPKFDIFIKQIKLMKNDTDYELIDCNLVYSLSQKSADSFTIIYCPPNSTRTVKLSQISWDRKGAGKPQDPGILTFPKEAYEALVESNSNIFKEDYILQRTFPKQVVDPMGKHIEFMGVVAASTGDGSWEFADGELTWDLSNTDVTHSSDPRDYVQINKDDAFSRTCAYQLVYKIKLDVLDEGFTSAAQQLNATTGPTVNPANGETKVYYKTDVQSETEDPRKAVFDVPEVRGLLYDLSFRKVDIDGNNVPGAVFTLTDSEGDEIGKCTTTANDQIYTFSGLPWGSYTLTEEVPDGYSANEDKMVRSQSWTIPLCYSTDRDLLVPDAGQYPNNMIYKGSSDLIFESGALKILNYEFTSEFLLKKISPDGLPLQGAEFKLYSDADLTQEVNAGLIASGANGVFTPSGFKLEPGVYYLVETRAPIGYIAPKSIGVLTVSADGFTIFWNGKNYTSEESVENGLTIYSIGLENNPSVPLPQTGGSGNGLTLVSGIAVLILTWSYFYMQYRRRNSNSDPKNHI